MNELDFALAQLGLEADAAKATALLLQEGAAAVDAYLASVNYSDRLAAWKAAR